jgi:hypothetical protein
MSRPLRIEEPSGPRFELALDQLEAGQSFVFLKTGLRLVDGALQVLVPTQWEPHSITKARALEELQRAQRNIARLSSSSSRFSAIVAGFPHLFILVYDYGMGGLWMCQIRGGEFEWYEGYPQESPAA